ncbi:Dde-domain-containing protein [Plakobranchus ocellatus]|uniref:Dde-domain-containing protein n=1 Tax=Plakobranchus ocellatus TaxID=259542 RepID=A0AAV4AAE5_9GAST|nr:Dde-domain-containing protein [Plakobranchus ocellatus]
MPRLFPQMVRNYKKKETGTRRNLSECQDMIDAFNAVMNQQMSINQASKYYKTTSLCRLESKTCLHNTDETGFVTDFKADIVLAARGSKRVNQSIGGSGREQVIVNCAAAATGKLLPLYVVYQGKNLYEAWAKDGPTDAAYTTSTKGWMEAPLFLDWFKKIFLHHTRDDSDKARLLIFDGHASHLSVDLIEEAKRNNVILMRLPAHMTHHLQPLDRAVFGPVKRKWQAMLIRYARTHNGPVGKKDFPKMMKELVNDSFKSETIRAGFSGTGICPFNNQAVVLEATPQTSLAPSDPASPLPSTSTSEPSSPAPPLPSTSARPSEPSSPAPQLPSTSARPSEPSSPAPPLLSTSATPSELSSPALPLPISPAPTSSLSRSATPPPSSVLSQAVSPSFKHFFLEHISPRFQASSRGRSARVQRFWYGESLTFAACIQRLAEATAAKEATTRGRGKGRSKGKGKKTASRPRSRSRSPLSESDNEQTSSCNRCGHTQGTNWVQCDLWYHTECTDIAISFEDLQNEDWLCDFCSQ